MQLSDFSYDLPPELIAQNPVEPRDSARLLVYTRATKEIVHAHIRDLPSFLPKETAVVANNSRVRHSRLFTDSGREVLILQSTPEDHYEALSRGNSPKDGEVLSFQDGAVTATVAGHHNGPAMNTLLLSFSLNNDALEVWLSENASLPLPPYITESKAQPGRYQTVFARTTGSAAAPTAGLHITPELIMKLESQGHSWNEVTLHVGLGTFLPLRSETIEDNILHSEVTEISADVANKLSLDVHGKHPILAIGTTSVRTLESHWENNMLIAGTKATNLFTYPGYHFLVPNMLLTNFHLPKSSLLLLVAAFLGNTSDRATVTMQEGEMISELQRIYACAIANNYRFFSFGDAMLIL